MSQITAPETRAPTTARKSVCDRTPSVSHIAAVAVQPAKYRTSPNLASMSANHPRCPCHFPFLRGLRKNSPAFQRGQVAAGAGWGLSEPPPLQQARSTRYAVVVERMIAQKIFWFEFAPKQFLKAAYAQAPDARPQKITEWRHTIAPQPRLFW
jgi:hypothetical protein